ncbi:hypothetical protein V5799_016939 [Amblyomma americanum]|uniref:Uncharacterized protein n=1 Tax=Amblyomma americanum TaxID=6943 RepID=A0AAQ4F4V6_AMBAM
MSGRGVSATTAARYSPTCGLLCLPDVFRMRELRLCRTRHIPRTRSWSRHKAHSVQWTSSQLSSDPGVKASCQMPTCSTYSQAKFLVLFQRHRRLPLCTDLWHHKMN